MTCNLEFQTNFNLFLFLDAYDVITNVANHINECVRQHENFQKMLAIQNSFTGNKVPKILEPGLFH